MQIHRFLLLCLLGICFTCQASAQAPGYDTSAYVAHTYRHAGTTLGYRLLPPVHMQAGKRYPLIVFLHGSGERGADNKKQLKNGGRFFADSASRAQHPAWVLVPQCPEADGWAPTKLVRSDSVIVGKSWVFSAAPGSKPTPALAAVLALTDSLAKTSSVDAARLYVGGLSMGGMGTFAALYYAPIAWAAAFPICGAGNPQWAKRYKVPATWIFHGDQDDAVLPENSTRMDAAMRAAGRNVKLMMYPGVKHNSWDKVFVEPGFLDWLFAQHK